MKKYTLQIQVEAPDRLSADDVTGLVNQMLDTGFADACDTVNDPDIDNGDAYDASELVIGNTVAVAVGGKPC